MTYPLDDIVIRLRKAAHDRGSSGFVQALLSEAADRIEELRFWLTRKKAHEGDDKGDAK